MRVRDHASPPGASSTRQTRRSRTLVGPVSLFWFVGRNNSSRSNLEDERMLARPAKVEAGMH